MNIGYSPSPTVEILPPALGAFQKTVPRVTVRLHDLAGNELADGVRNGTLELAVMQRPQEANSAGLTFESLHDYPICVAVPPEHALAKLKAVPVARLAAEKLVVFRRREYTDYHALLARVFHGLNPRPAIAIECDGANSLMTEIAAGRGVAIVSLVFSNTFGARLKLRPLTPAPAPQEVGIVRALKGDVTPAGEKFCAQLRAAAKRLSAS